MPHEEGNGLTLRTCVRADETRDPSLLASTLSSSVGGGVLAAWCVSCSWLSLKGDATFYELCPLFGRLSPLGGEMLPPWHCTHGCGKGRPLLH